jgi:hypothetical protein
MEIPKSQTTCDLGYYFALFWSGKLRGRRCEEVRIQMLKLGHLQSSAGKA